MGVDDGGGSQLAVDLVVVVAVSSVALGSEHALGGLVGHRAVDVKHLEGLRKELQHLGLSEAALLSRAEGAVKSKNRRSALSYSWENSNQK